MSNLDLSRLGTTPEFPLTMRHATAFLPKGALLYLASPYSLHPRGIHEATREIQLVAGSMVNAGIRVFSPIAYTHGIAMVSGIDPFSHDLWMPVDEPFMDGAHALVVVMLDSWEDSYGTKLEIAAFRQAGKPVYYVDPRHDGWLQSELQRLVQWPDGMEGVRRAEAKKAAQREESGVMEEV